MKEGYLERSFTVSPAKGKNVNISTKRFLSMAEPDLGLIRYRVNPENFKGEAEFTVYIDADVRNQTTAKNSGKIRII